MYCSTLGIQDSGSVRYLYVVLTYTAINSQLKATLEEATRLIFLKETRTNVPELRLDPQPWTSCAPTPTWRTVYSLVDRITRLRSNLRLTNIFVVFSSQSRQEVNRSLLIEHNNRFLYSWSPQDPVRLARARLRLQNSLSLNNLPVFITTFVSFVLCTATRPTTDYKSLRSSCITVHICCTTVFRTTMTTKIFAWSTSQFFEAHNATVRDGLRLIVSHQHGYSTTN